MSTQQTCRQRGFSLVELSVSLVVTAIIGLMLWRWVAATQEPATLQAIQSELAEAQAAVEGFVLTRHRLPCPAADTAGVEACGSSTAILLPWRTLGLSSDKGALHYGVNRGGSVDLATAPAATIAPDLNLAFTGVPILAVSAADAPAAKIASDQVTMLIAAAAARRAAVNGLDWCHVVRTFASNTAADGVLEAGYKARYKARDIKVSMPVAYILVHPGRNGQFDGNNVVPAIGSFRFDLRGLPPPKEDPPIEERTYEQYDDISMAVGPSDLAARTGCVARLSDAQSAAQRAFAQYDTVRLMQEYWSLRASDIVTAEDAVSSAKTAVVLAAAAAAYAASSLAIGIASAANTEAITLFAVAIQTANVVIAATEVGFAADELVQAEANLVEVRAKLVATSAYAAQAYETLAEVMTRAIGLDEKGLNP